MIGRVLRVAPGKADAIILDHSGAVFRHGFAEDRVEWTLDVDERAASPTHETRLEYNSASRLLECTQCTMIREAGKPCPHCGFLPQRPPRDVLTAAGDLGLVDRHGKVKADRGNPAQWHAQLVHIARERGYKPGWAAHQYKTRFEFWPPRGDVVPIEPTPEVLAGALAHDRLREVAECSMTVTTFAER